MVQRLWYVHQHHMLSLIATADSDIIYANAAGMSIVILNSYEAAVELLDKRSNIYSSRSVLVTQSLRLPTSAEFGYQW